LRNSQINLLSTASLFGLCLVFGNLCNAEPSAAHQATGHQTGSHVLAQEKIPNLPGSTLTAMTFELKPGETSLPHVHSGFLYVYVLEGAVKSQLGEGPVTTYHAGQSWVETPGVVHGVAESASDTDSASILVIFVGPDEEPLTERIK
jgi:quercetin dioxygenase-like cupin family protein